jgi:NTP pyrophosphatase (non-canonical NTP hydrolase)
MIGVKNLNKLSKECHINAVEKGFYENPLPLKTSFFLVISELVECFESYRKNGLKNVLIEYEIERNSHEKHLKDFPFQLKFKHFVKDSPGDELADTVIRLLDIAGYLEISFKDIIKVNFPHESFENDLYYIIETIINEFETAKKYNIFDIYILNIIRLVEMVASEYNIDLEKHIELKTQYNSTRERLHGKNF